MLGTLTSEVMPEMQFFRGAYRRAVIGGGISLIGLVALLLCMLPLRDHLSTATPALLFVIPVIVCVMIGGFAPGVLVALVGFLFYDLFFLPPYGRLTIHSPQNLTALFVYLAVVLVMARVVTNLKDAREEGQRREQDAARLYELSQALIGDLTPSQLLDHIVSTVQAVFAPRWTAMVLPELAADTNLEGAKLAVAARAGQTLTEADIASLTESEGQIRSLGLSDTHSLGRVAVALVASNRPVGLLVLQEVEFARQDRALLGTFANQAALAVERAQLQDQALRTLLLEEVDRWRGAMMGAVSHDLRTPLASIKAAVSGLRQSGDAIGPADASELLELIELQSDRLARLVTNLLDMTRIDSGALEVRTSATAFEDLVAEALLSIQGLVPPERVIVDAPSDLPLLQIDHVLVGQVLANLLENAARLSPDDSTIKVGARVVDGRTDALMEVSVGDEGPGIALGEREQVFKMFSQNSGGGRAGLGLAIAKAFVEAHGGTIWIDPTVTKGARFVFTLPVADSIPSRV
jgi:two-component system, OmpR family, sensor histidine kinase KdpD